MPKLCSPCIFLSSDLPTCRLRKENKSVHCTTSKRASSDMGLSPFNHRFDINDFYWFSKHFEIMHDSIPICRVCLKTSLEYIDLETPFDVPNELADMQNGTLIQGRKSVNEISKELTYLDCFKECTRLDMTKDDNGPQSLCSACGLELRIAYEFIRKAVSAAEILETTAAQTKLEKSRPCSIMNEPILLEDDSSKFSEYEEILDEKSSGLDIENDEKIDFDTNMDEDAKFTCEYCEKLFISEFLLNSHITKVHCDTIEEFMKYDCSGEGEHEECSSIIGVDLVCNEESSYGSFEKNEEHQLEVQMNKNNIALESNNNSDTNFTVIDDNGDEGDNVAKTKKTKPKLAFSRQLEQIKEQIIIKCADCEKYFTTEHSLQIHHRTKHRMITKSIHFCEICKKTLSINDKITKCSDCDIQEKESKEHENVHNDQEHQKKFVCFICSKTFATHGLLNAHLKYHQRKQANIKSDACTICGKQFSTKHYLRLHMQVHTNDRELHKCSQCEKLYVTKTALDNHMKLHNGETIKCVSCHKEFSRQYELNVHMRFHTRDYPFECEICGKKFAIKGHLRTHMWRHQGLKLQCEDCGKLFTSSKALQEHSFTHSEMPFPCSYCPKAYPSKQKFKVHLRTAHSVDLNEEELQKIARNIVHKPLLRKKLTLVQADSVMKEVEVKTKDDDTEEVQDFVITLF